MSAEAHARVAALFEALVTLDPAARAERLAEIDPPTRERLERLLAADAATEDPLALAVAAGAEDLNAFARAGQRIGPYRVLREIGAGGMGAVLLAERADGQFAQQVAIKLIRGFPTDDGMRRLRQERQILAQLDHPNIARLLDGGETADGQPYVVMEYVPGVALLDYLARAPCAGGSDPAAMRARLALFDRIAEAVQHAHERLVIHRDLKPGNVIVRNDGTPKLLDFGVAKLVDLSAASDPRQTSTRIWTPGYAAPEQQQGGVITTATDVFGLAACLREMLSGERAPGQGGGLPPGFVALRLDPDLRGILAKASSERAEDRYPTVEALRADLARWREGRPVRAAPDTPAYRLRKFVARHRLAATAAVLALLAAAAFVWRIDRERERAILAEERARSALRSAEHDAAVARSALQFLADAFTSALPEQALSSQVSVRDLLDAARAQLDQRAGQDPALRSGMQRLLGHLYNSLGEPSVSVELFAAGLADPEVRERDEALALATDLDGYAGALGALGRGRESLDVALRAAELRRRHAPGEPEQELLALDQLGFGYYRIQDYERAEATWSRGLEIAATLPAPPVDIVAGMHQALAGMLTFRGRSAEALDIATRGLAIVDRELPHASPLRVNLLRTRGEALNAEGRAAEAEPVLRQAIEVQEHAVGRKGIRLATLYNALGIVLNDLGRYREATEALTRSLALERDSGGSRMESAVGTGNLAAVRESAGDYDGALALFEQARAEADESGVGPDDLARRIIERNHARCLGLAGQLHVAAQRFEDLRARARALDGADSFEYAMTTWQAVVVARRMQDLHTGLPLIDESEARWRALLPDEHPVFAHVLRTRADFARLQKDPARAERLQREAIERLEAAGSLPVDLAIARAELAAMLAGAGRATQARALLQQSLPILRQALLPQEVNRAAAESLAAAIGENGPPRRN